MEEEDSADGDSDNNSRSDHSPVKTDQPSPTRSASFDATDRIENENDATNAHDNDATNTHDAEDHRTKGERCNETDGNNNTKSHFDTSNHNHNNKDDDEEENEKDERTDLRSCDNQTSALNRPDSSAFTPPPPLKQHHQPQHQQKQPQHQPHQHQQYQCYSSQEATLSTQQSQEGNNSNSAWAGRPFSSQYSSSNNNYNNMPSQTTTHTPCRDVLLTQTGDCCSMTSHLDLSISPCCASQSQTSPGAGSSSQLPPLPWAKLVPCEPTAAAANVPLYPRPPPATTAPTTATTAKSSSSFLSHSPPTTVRLLGVSNLRMGDSFNHYTLGRDPACDIVVSKPASATTTSSTTSSSSSSSRQKRTVAALHQWAYSLISHQHCTIFASLEPDPLHHPHPAAIHPSSRTPDIKYKVQIYIQDQSNNGTIINQTTLLKRGQSRILYSGDEICLVNPQILRKKVRSERLLQPLLQHYSYVFINLFQQAAPVMPAIPLPPPPPTPTTAKNNDSNNNNNNNTTSPSNASWTLPMVPSPTMFPVPAPRRKPAVNVRATKQHRPSLPPPPPPPPSPLSFPVGQQQLQRRPQKQSQNGQQKQQPQPPPPPRRCIEMEYDIRQVLGTGTVGEVRRAIHRKTGQERAVKIIKRQQLLWGRLDAAANSIQAEAAILQELEHPYVVKLVDFFVTSTVVYLVMELLQGGDLYYRIVQKGRYSEVDSRRVMRRLLSAIYYLHEERQIVHRDLKPENILLVSPDNDVHIQLTDFGLAKSVNGESLKTFCGTPLYIPPEVSQRRNTITGTGRYGKPADMWSLGVILYILLSGCPPFDVGPGLLDVDIHDDWAIEFPEADWKGISPAARDLVRALLIMDPQQRLTVRQACQHRWILEPDGDTHVHPLDDPKLAVSQKRLFPKVMGAVSAHPINKQESGIAWNPTKDAKNENDSTATVSSTTADYQTNDQPERAAVSSGPTPAPEQSVVGAHDASVICDRSHGRRMMPQTANEPPTSWCENPKADLGIDNGRKRKESDGDVNSVGSLLAACDSLEPTLPQENASEIVQADQNCNPSDEQPREALPAMTSANSEVRQDDAEKLADQSSGVTPSSAHLDFCETERIMRSQRQGMKCGKAQKDSRGAESVGASSISTPPVNAAMESAVLVSGTWPRTSFTDPAISIEQSRRPLSPVSTNIEQSGKTVDLRLDVVVDPSSRKDGATSLVKSAAGKSSNELRPKAKKKHVTKAKSKKGAGNNKSKQKGSSHVDGSKRELTDDEIAEFSDETESISSFGTLAGTRKVAEESIRSLLGQSFDQEESSVAGTACEQTDIPSHLEQSTKRRKRRVTDTTGETKVSTEKATKRAKATNTAASHRQKNTDSKARKTCGKSRQAESTKPDLKTEKHRQTTLSSWIKNG